MDYSTSIWPQDRIVVDCFAVMSMDITAPFVRDMGLHFTEIEPLRTFVRSKISQDSRIINRQLGLGRSSEEAWLMDFAEAGKNLLPPGTLVEF